MSCLFAVGLGQGRGDLPGSLCYLSSSARVGAGQFKLCKVWGEVSIVGQAEGALSVDGDRVVVGAGRPHYVWDGQDLPPGAAVFCDKRRMRREFAKGQFTH
jgi:hypothetical protein